MYIYIRSIFLLPFFTLRHDIVTNVVIEFCCIVSNPQYHTIKSLLGIAVFQLVLPSLAAYAVSFIALSLRPYFPFPSSLSFVSPFPSAPFYALYCSPQLGTIRASTLSSFRLSIIGHFYGLFLFFTLALCPFF